MSDISSSLPHFFRMLDNSYSFNVLKSECLSRRESSWPLTVYLFLWNLKMVCKPLYKYKSLVLFSIFFQLEIEFFCENVCALVLIKCTRSKQTKSENNSLLDHLFFTFFIQSSLALSTTLVSMQAKTGFDRPIFNYILPLLHKSGMI